MVHRAGKLAGFVQNPASSGGGRREEAANRSRFVTQASHWRVKDRLTGKCVTPVDDSLVRSGAHGWKNRKRPRRPPRPSRRGESVARGRRAQGSGTQKLMGGRRG